MKQVTLFATVLLLAPLLWAEQNPLYKSVVVETFDGPDAGKFPKGSTAIILDQEGNRKTIDIAQQNIVWRVARAFASRYATEGFPTSTYTNSWPIDLFGLEPEDAETKQIFGIRSKFDRQGYNYFSIYTGTEIQGEWLAMAVPLSDDNYPGQIKNINVWVWGANYDYSIEVTVRDYQGITYALPLDVVSGSSQETFRAGSLQFTGWREMAANIPNNVPQSSKYGTEDFRLKLVKFIVRTSPYERVDDFYIYFDQLQVIVDPYSNFYDGKDLAQPTRIKQIWGGENTSQSANQ